MKTTINTIKSFNPCKDGLDRLVSGQFRNLSFEQEFGIEDCLLDNTVGDVLWLIAKQFNDKTIAVEFAQKMANSVAHLKDASYVAVAAASYADAAAASYVAADAASFASYASYAASYASARSQKLSMIFSKCLLFTLIEKSEIA